MGEFPLHEKKINMDKELTVTFLERLKTIMLKNERIKFIKRTSWVLPHIVRRT